MNKERIKQKSIMYTFPPKLLKVCRVSQKKCYRYLLCHQNSLVVSEYTSDAGCWSETDKFLILPQSSKTGEILKESNRDYLNPVTPKREYDVTYR